VNEEPPVLDPEDTLRRRRLESWKEIAAYFGRDVRTVKRWEKDEALPVHRHHHKRLASIYAFVDEVEAWQQERRQRGPQMEPSIPEDAPRRRAVWLVWTVVAVVLALVAAAALYWLKQPAIVPFEERDWALITQFENRTGEAVFDGSVEYALERELVNSRFVNVVPRERVHDALSLMMKPLDTPVDRDIGREVSLRDGGIRALIAGRVEKLGGTYVISADLVEPPTGVAFRSFSEEATGEHEVVRAIARLSGRVRQGLGEQLSAARSIEELESTPRSGMERVSTPSLRALHLYSQGDALVQQHNPAEASSVLQEAIREDPDFASAHILLAHVLSNLGRDAEARPHFQKALELAETTSGRERLFIQASCYERFHRDEEKAIETLEILLRLYPDHYWATTNVALAYEKQNRPRQAVPHTVRRADLRPNNFDHQLRAAHALTVASEVARAEEYAGRARTLIELEQSDPLRAWRSAWVRLFPAHSEWARGRLKEAVHEVDRVAGEIESAPAEDRAPLQWEVGSFYLTLGKERAAREMFGSMSSAPDNLALVALGLDDQTTMKRQLQIAPASHRSAILFARAGLPAEAERALGHPERARRVHSPFLPFVWEALARGELAMARRQRTEAIALLQDVIPTLRSWPTPYYFLGVETVSRAWEQEGDQARSIDTLEAAAHHGVASVFWGPAPLFWMKNELRRADLYRETGREADAQRVEAGLLKLLTEADPDFVILRDLERRATARSAPGPSSDNAR
jgi:tetratricopeptide (TPR) repeat protein